MKSYRYESGRAENSIPPDCYFCLTQLYPYITILSVLVLYPAVFTHTVCNMWFDSQALVLTAAKKKTKTNKLTNKKMRTHTILHNESLI